MDAAKLCVDKEPADTRRANIFLDSARLALRTLSQNTLHRLSGLTVQVDVTEARREWNNYRIPIMVELDELADLAKEKEVGYITPAQQLISDKAKVQGRIDQQCVQVKAAIAKMDEDLAAIDTEDVITKEFVNNHQCQAQQVRLLLRPGLTVLHDELTQLDPTNHLAVSEALSRLLTEHDRLLATAVGNLVTRKVDDSTLVFLPQLNSTPNLSLLASSSAVSGAGSRSHYGYPREQYPEFDGDVIKYPSWKKEMEEEVLVGKGDAFGLRLLCKLTPHKNIGKQFQTKDEAFKFLDELYANPRVVSQRVIKEFMAKKGLAGANDEMKLINLYETLNQLYLTLKIVKQEHQLRDSNPMIALAVTLLPTKYKLLYADQLEKAEDAKDTPGLLSAAEEFDILSAWLKKKAGQLRIHCAEQLSGRAGSQHDDTPSDRTGGGGGGEDRHRDRDRKRKNKSKGAGGGVEYNGFNAGGELRGFTRTGDSVLAHLPKEVKEALKKEWAKIGPCPVPGCNSQGHAYEGKEAGKWSASRCLQDCKVFMKDWDVEMRAAYVMQKKFCIRCLSRSHSSKECRRPTATWFCRVSDSQGKPCGGQHHNAVHGAKKTNMTEWE